MAPSHALEDALRQVDDPLAFLSGIFFHSPVAFQVYRANGTCLVTNPAFRELFGSEPPPEYNVLTDEIARDGGVLDLIRRAFDGETVRMPAIWYDPRELTQVNVAEGKRVAIEATFFPLKSRTGAVEHVAVVFKDLTLERTLLERAERERDRLRFQASILENVRDSIVVTDLQGKIINWNAGAERVFGYRAEEALGHTPELLYPDEDPSALARDLGDIAKGADFVGEWKGRRKDGTTVWVEMKTTLMTDAEGKPLGFIGIGKDVSERKRFESERRQAEAEREEALRAAEGANRAKDEFLAMLGHELRNPLSPIVTALQLMKLKGDARSTKEQQVIERQVDHLVRLVDDLLDVSRITRGKVELKKTVIDLNEAISKAVEMASPLLEQRRHHLTVSVPKNGMRLEADPARLAQIISNLLTNAAKYTDVGGRVELRAYREAGDLVVAVRDNGIGIAPDLLPNVFDLFVQGRRSSDRAQGGLGIGLTLVQNLVQMHGGSVVAKSEGKGRGSEFIVRLPALAADAAHDAEIAAEHRIARASKARRVLVVDDNVDSADLVAELLRAAGHDVMVAHDGPSAIGLLDHFEPEVGVLDIGLPVMDGYELARRLREILPAPHLIAVTGYGQDYDRLRTADAGFDNHLVKPVVPRLLLATIDAGRDAAE